MLACWLFEHREKQYMFFFPLKYVRVNIRSVRVFKNKELVERLLLPGSFERQRSPWFMSRLSVPASPVELPAICRPAPLDSLQTLGQNQQTVHEA